MAGTQKLGPAPPPRRAVALPVERPLLRPGTPAGVVRTSSGTPRTAPPARTASATGWRVLPRRRARRPEAMLGTAFAALVGLSLLLYVVTVRQEVHLNGQQAQLRRQHELNVILRARLAERRSPQLVEQQATDQLGMALPSQVLFVSGTLPTAPPSPRPPAPSGGLAEAY